MKKQDREAESLPGGWWTTNEINEFKRNFGCETHFISDRFVATACVKLNHRVRRFLRLTAELRGKGGVFEATRNSPLLASHAARR
jgi:hypothetical protein